MKKVINQVIFDTEDMKGISTLICTKNSDGTATEWETLYIYNGIYFLGIFGASEVHGPKDDLGIIAWCLKDFLDYIEDTPWDGEIDVIKYLESLS